MRYIFKICCFASVVFFTNCERIQDNKRLVFIGNLIDDVGDPIQEATITSALFDKQTFNNLQNILGQNISDKDGKFELVSLVPLGVSSNLLINTNIESKLSIEPLFPRLRLNFFVDIFNENLEVSLDDLMLPRLSHLEIKIRKTSNSSAILNWSLDYQNSICIIDIMSQDDIDNISFCNDFVRSSSQNNPAEPEGDRSFISLRNSIAIFTYSLNNEPDQTIEISINKTDNVFEFTY